jgi:hypothetical protein
MSSAAPEASFLPGAATLQPRSAGDLVSLSLQRPGGRRSVSAVTALLVASAVAMLAMPALSGSGSDQPAASHHHHHRASAAARGSR